LLLFADKDLSLLFFSSLGLLLRDLDLCLLSLKERVGTNIKVTHLDYLALVLSTLILNNKGPNSIYPISQSDTATTNSSKIMKTSFDNLIELVFTIEQNSSAVLQKNQ